MSKNCIICNKKMGFFKKIYEDKYCQECYERQMVKEQKMIELERALANETKQKEFEKRKREKENKLNYIKKYLLMTDDNLNKIFKILQFPMHYSDNFKTLDSSMGYILFEYIKIMIDELKENFTLNELKELSITRNVAKLTERLNYLYKDTFDANFYNRAIMEDNQIYIEKCGKPANYNRLDDEEFIMDFSTIDDLEEYVNTVHKNIIEVVNNLYGHYTEALNKNLSNDYVRELKNKMEYEKRSVYYQLALNILYLVVYSKEIEKFLNHPEISQIINKLDSEVHNDEYLVDKIYDLYNNLYKQEFSINFEPQDIVNILIYNRQQKKVIHKVENNGLIKENIEDYVFDIDIQPLIQLSDENEIYNKIFEEIKNNIVNLQEYISLDKLLYIEDSILENVEKISSQIKKEKAKLERERILNGNFEKEKKINNKELDYSNISNGYEFESYIANLYKILGYKVLNVTSKSGDQGADVIIEKDNIKFAIQVKYYSTPVGNKAVQEVVAAKNFYKTSRAMVVTNSVFTQQAKALAKVNDVILVDRTELKQLINQAKSN